MAFAIVTKDSIVVKNVLGHHKITELKEQPNASPNDYFHLGSNTKAITSFIAAYLVESKKINWNTKFFELFPELKNSSDPDYSEITLKALLSHRAGIQPFTSGSEYQKLPTYSGNKQEKRAAFAKYVLTLPAVRTENAFNYSNAGYSVAALMLEKASGKPWEDLVTEIVKGKLQLDFVFGWPNRNFQQQPWGHWMENGIIVPLDPQTKYDLSLAEPAGDISMKLHDYARFIQLNIQGLAGIENILKPESYQFLHTAEDGYALGWGNYTKDGKHISEHAGSDGTFFSYAQIDRDKLTGYIVMVNSGTPEAQKAVSEMIREMKRKY